MTQTKSKGKSSLLEQTEQLDDGVSPSTVATAAPAGAGHAEGRAEAGTQDVGADSAPETGPNNKNTADSPGGGGKSATQPTNTSAGTGGAGECVLPGPKAPAPPPTLPNKVHVPVDTAYAAFQGMLQSMEDRKRKLAQQLYDNRDQWRTHNMAYQEAVVAVDDKAMVKARAAMEELDADYQYLELQQKAFENADRAKHVPDSVRKLAEAANQEVHDQMAVLAKQWAQAIAVVNHLEQNYINAVEILHGISVQTRKVHQRYAACREVLGKGTGWLADPAEVVHVDTLKGPIFFNNVKIAQLFKTGNFK